MSIKSIYPKIHLMRIDRYWIYQESNSVGLSVEKSVRAVIELNIMDGIFDLDIQYDISRELNR